MKHFRDAENRDWFVACTVDSLKRVKDLCSIDLLTGEGLQRVTNAQDLWAMLETWPNVLWALCLTKATELEISQEAWAEMLLADVDGEPVFDSAVTATLEELANFFRKVGRRSAAVAIDKIVSTRTIRETELAARTGQRMDETLDREQARLEARVTASLSSITGDASTKSPAS